ncbi:sulfatase family protein [Cyclobacterium xiamenense]|uniref:sulfatase family protein n=1 Tax=Cyclobacterium xiamenense TaxID=1297121 RepID=UPI0012B7847C|nr:sulfatase [Cyclobacterium xiamenense]
MKKPFQYLFLACCLFGCLPAVAQKTNIVFFLADDCTNWDLSSYGSPDAKTPAIDRLAREGMKFNRCYQAAPMCSPTRHNLLTGLYPVKTGAYPNHTFAEEGTKSLVHYLEPLGYRVAQAGKRHIYPEEVFPFEYLDNDKNPDFVKVEGFLQEVTASKQPFALFLCSNEPHSPWDKGNPTQYNAQSIQLPPNFVDTPETRDAFSRYLAEISYMDGQVGQALDLLGKYNLDENTLFVFASEQGNSFPFAKWTLYEAGVKSALIARLPDRIPAGSESEAIVDYTDLVPTFIELGGGTAPEHLDGHSLWPLLEGRSEAGKDYSFSLQTTRGIIHGSEHYGIRSVVDAEYRYIWNLTPEVPFRNIETNGDRVSDWYKSWLAAAQTDEGAENLVRKYSHRPTEELYHIKNDRWCLVNLAGDPTYAEVIRELRGELLAWMEACGDEGQQTELDALAHQRR